MLSANPIGQALLTQALVKDVFGCVAYDEFRVDIYA